VGDLFPHIRKDFKEKSSIPQGLPCGYSLYCVVLVPIFGLLDLPENWTGSFDDVWSVAYAINQYGMPFLLYCFLQVTGGFYVIGARVYCFVLPVLTMFGIAARAG
jgi:hypothetical protein